MTTPDGLAAAAWLQLTRLGEAQILLPAMAVALLWLARQPEGRRLAGHWALGTGLTALLTTATKVAFIGFGIGIAALDFTGISGHAMFAAAVLPVLLRVAAAPASAAARRRVITAGYLLAAGVAVSRVVVQAHSWSEVVCGFALGAAASAWALRAGHWPALNLARWVPGLLAGWALVAVIGAPPSQTHGLVTQLALAVSGRSQPFERWQLHQPSLHQPSQYQPSMHQPSQRW